MKHEIKLSLKPNAYGYYGISYFDENKKHKHLVFNDRESALLYIANLSNNKAERTFKGSIFEIWTY